MHIFFLHIYVENSALSVCFYLFYRLWLNKDISSIQQDGVDRTYIGCIVIPSLKSFIELPFTTDWTSVWPPE